MKILVLGGAGAMAEVIERDLLASGTEVIIADRDKDRVAERAKLLGGKVRQQIIDLRSPNIVAQLKASHADVLVNSTWYEFNVDVMKAAIQARIHYLDLGGLFWKTKEQQKLHAFAKKNNVTCILGMGSTPGIMNVLVSYGTEEFDRVYKVELRCAGTLLERPKQSKHFVPPYSIKTLMDEMLFPPPVLRNGKIVFEEPLAAKVPMHFEMPVGNATGFYAIHSELASLPHFLKKKGVQELDFAYAYDPQVIALITTLHQLRLTSKEKIAVGGCMISPHDFMAEVVKRYPHPQKDPKDVEMLSAEIWGERNGRRGHVRMVAVAQYHAQWHKSAGTVDTGVPASIAAQWIAQGRIRTPGVFHPEDVLEPILFFKELAKRTISVYEQRGNKKKRLR